MSSKPNQNTPMFNDETVLDFVRDRKEPCSTASDIAEQFGVTNSAVHYRLKNLEEDGKVKSKNVGASAVVWYPVG